MTVNGVLVQQKVNVKHLLGQSNTNWHEYTPPLADLYGFQGCGTRGSAFNETKLGHTCKVHDVEHGGWASGVQKLWQLVQLRALRCKLGGLKGETQSGVLLNWHTLVGSDDGKA